MRRISWTRESVDDLASIFEYSSEIFGIAQAAETVASIHATIERTLSRFPAAGRSRPELGLNVRSFPAPPFVVVYMNRAGEVKILRIIHGKRDIHPPLISFLLAS